MTRLAVYSKNPVLVRGLESILSETGSFTLLRACGNLASLFKCASQEEPDVILLETSHEINTDSLRELKSHITSSSKIILWVGEIATELVFQAMGLEVRGILRKTLPIELQVECLQKVADGELWFENTLMHDLLSASRVTLTRRESQVVQLITQGLKNKEIAAVMRTTEGTTKTYLSKIFGKIGVNSRFELALLGIKNLKNLTSDQPVVIHGHQGKALGSPSLRCLVVERSHRRI